MQEITLSFHGLDSRDQVQVVGLGDKYLDSQDPSQSSQCSESLCYCTMYLWAGEMKLMMLNGRAGY